MSIPGQATSDTETDRLQVVKNDQCLGDPRCQLVGAVAILYGTILLGLPIGIIGSQCATIFSEREVIQIIQMSSAKVLQRVQPHDRGRTFASDPWAFGREWHVAIL